MRVVKSRCEGCEQSGVACEVHVSRSHRRGRACDGPEGVSSGRARPSWSSEKEEEAREKVPTRMMLRREPWTLRPPSLEPPPSNIPRAVLGREPRRGDVSSRHFKDRTVVKDVSSSALESKVEVAVHNELEITQAALHRAPEHPSTPVSFQTAHRAPETSRRRRSRPRSDLHPHRLHPNRPSTRLPPRHRVRERRASSTQALLSI